MADLPYHSIPETPEDINATNSIARFVDALGFRYRWATEGLTENEINFRPVESSMNMMELIQHIYEIALGVDRIFGGNDEKLDDLTNYENLRNETLRLFGTASKRLKSMKDEDLADCNYQRDVLSPNYTFWYFLNGPIADALTHVGQISSWRRIAGNPIPEGVNPFTGKVVFAYC